MIIMSHANRIDFARNRIAIDTSRHVTGSRANDTFFALVNRAVRPAGVLRGN